MSAEGEDSISYKFVIFQYFWLWAPVFPEIVMNPAEPYEANDIKNNSYPI